MYCRMGGRVHFWLKNDHVSAGHRLLKPDYSYKNINKDLEAEHPGDQALLDGHRRGGMTSPS